MENKKCFVSYAHVDKEFVYTEIIPILNQLELGIWIDSEQIYEGVNILESIAKGINQADFIIAIFNIRSTYLNFEIGNALGRNIPIIGIIKEDDYEPTDFRQVNFIRYSINRKEQFLLELIRAIRIISENVINSSICLMSKGEKVIGMKVGMETSDFQSELKFTSEFIELIKEISGAQYINLIHLGKGTITSFLGIDLKPLTELIEKILFFAPEWKRRKLENLKTDVEN